jgi:hypothetical protein
MTKGMTFAELRRREGENCLKGGGMRMREGAERMRMGHVGRMTDKKG